ncbi:MAG: DUF255 domain-containing protein [Deltaproteobacteria bacterium]|nr:DUF255 domain-containing protein [Deltaproteobacteria bacterium]
MIVVLAFTALALAGWWWYGKERAAKWDAVHFIPNQGVASVKKYNRLGETKSPYLLQHKDNPVHWFPWGEEAH